MSNVLNRTTKQYLISVSTPDYPDVDWIINPDLSSVVGIAEKYWKISGDSVLEMTSEEKAIVDAAEAGATPATGENYLTAEYNSKNQLLKETWYRDKTELGTYTVKVKEVAYTYEENAITQTVTRYFSLGETTYSTETISFYKDLDIKKTYTEKTL
jgi:hypothetical protein